MLITSTWSCVFVICFFFFFKQKTAYEMRISDWSSDVCSSDLLPVASRTAVEAFIAPLGLAEWIADEGRFNEVTALSGCGPAFLFRFVDALARAGEAIGLPADQAARMALATVRGSASMAAMRSEEHTSELQSLMRISYAVFCLKKKKQ